MTYFSNLINFVRTHLYVRHFLSFDRVTNTTTRYDSKTVCSEFHCGFVLGVGDGDRIAGRQSS